jgi:hypothetical protein
LRNLQIGGIELLPESQPADDFAKYCLNGVEPSAGVTVVARHRPVLGLAVVGGGTGPTAIEDPFTSGAQTTHLAPRPQVP